jgi:hypothetical protein
VILSSDGRTKPAFGARLNPSHPGRIGLRSLFLFNEAHGTTVTDVVRGIQGTFTNSPIWTPGSRWGRPAVKFGSGGTAYIALGNPAALDFSAAKGLTVIWSHKCDVKPNWVNRYFVSKGGEWQVDCTGPTSSGVRFLLNGGGGAGGLVAESRTVVDGEQYAYAITYDQTSKFSQVIREGIVTASATMSVFGSIPTSSANVNIGSAAGTLAWDGSIHWIGFWDYVLPLNLIAEIQSRPFLLVAQSPRVSVLFGGSASTLSASGSLSFTGSGTFSTVPPNSNLSMNAGIVFTPSATFSTVPPNTNLSVTGGLSFTASATFTAAPPAGSLTVNGGIQFTAASTFDSVAPGGSLTVNGGIAFTAAATFNSVAPNANLSVNAGLAFAGAATFSSTVPNANLSATGGIAFTAAATFTASSPSGTLSVGGGIAFGASATFTAAPPNANLSVNAGLSFVGSAAFNSVGPAGGMAISGGIQFNGSAAFTSVAPNANLSATGSLNFVAVAALTVVPPAGSGDQLRKTNLESVYRNPSVAVIRKQPLKSTRRDADG